jgi:hypothetical protein
MFSSSTAKVISRKPQLLLRFKKREVFAMRSKSLDHFLALSERFDCHAAITLGNHRRNIHLREA